MKITKNANCDYEKNNISEYSGYIKWYNRAETTINRIVFIVLSYAGLLLFLYSPLFQTIKSSFKAPKGNMETFLFFVVEFVIIILIIPLFWRIMQLAIVSKGKLNENCVLKIKGSFTCIYNEKLTRRTALISLIVPGVLFVLLFSILTVLSDGVQKTFFLLMLYRTLLCATEDIGIIWCITRHVGKEDIIFGEYKKTQALYDV